MWASDFRTEAVTAPPSRLELPLERDFRWRHEVSEPFPLGVNPPRRAVVRRGSWALVAHYPSKGMNRLAGSGAFSIWALSLGRGAAGQWRLSKVAVARGVLVVVRLKEADERHVARRPLLTERRGAWRAAQRAKACRKRLHRWQSRGGRGGLEALRSSQDSAVEGALSFNEE